MAVILGLDPARSFGWGTLDDGNVRDYGVLKLPREADPAYSKIQQLLEDQRPDRAVIEGVSFAKFVGAHASYWRIRTLVELVCARAGVELVACEVGVLKLWATGHGNATKAEMCAAARSRLKVPLYGLGEPGASKVKAEAHRDEDKADALLCAAWATAYRPD